MTATLSSRDSLSSSYPRTLTPVNLPLAAVTARTPSESNVRAVRGREITTRGCENHRETEDGGTGGAGISGSNVGVGLLRTGITSTLPISASRVPHQNSRMPTVTRYFTRLSVFHLTFDFILLDWWEIYNWLSAKTRISTACISRESDSK